jgi:hypothetical protein
MSTQVTQVISKPAPIVVNFGWWFENGGVPTIWSISGNLQTPLHTTITFDATGGPVGLTYLGDGTAPPLPMPTVPAGLHIVAYRWDFGNGLVGIGSTSNVTYTYPIAVPGLQVSLSVVDSLGRTTSTALRINLNSQILGSGSMRERQGTAR